MTVLAQTQTDEDLDIVSDSLHVLNRTIKTLSAFADVRRHPHTYIVVRSNGSAANIINRTHSRIGVNRPLTSMTPYPTVQRHRL